MSSLCFTGLWGIVGAIHYPFLVKNSADPSNSITILNSSSALTLKIMLIITLVGMPLVLAYTFFVYRAFKGKLKEGETLY
jgi:cytochrome d ubiquinol oxidase subunit II